MRFRKRINRRERNTYSRDVVRDKKTMELKPLFVETIPYLSKMDKGTLYVSMRFATLSHLCPCGCGRLVDVTLNPTTRSLTYDGEYLTLKPSIGVKFPCRSHYSIVRNAIIWYPSISELESKWYNRFWERWNKSP